MRFCTCCDCSCSMRMSAIICCTSLLAASAGVAMATARARPSRAKDNLFVMALSLRGDDEMRAAVFRERRILMTRIEREFLAVAHRAEPIGRNPERQQVGACGDCPLFAQRQIVLGRPAFVAVAFDRD